MMTQIRISREKVRQMRNNGMTYEEIGVHFSVTRQRIHQLATGYMYKQNKNPRFKMYRRHLAGHANPNLPCDYCQWAGQNKNTII